VFAIELLDCSALMAIPNDPCLFMADLSQHSVSLCGFYRQQLKLRVGAAA